MGIEIRLPNITATTERDQLVQVKSYLYQLAGQLQWALGNLDTASGNVLVAQPANTGKGSAVKFDEVETFNSIKSLIIKSADIVDAYYETISKKLEGEYVATSDFGEYKEQTTQDIQANSNGVDALYSNVQTILGAVGTIEDSLIEVDAHINSGLLYYDDAGIPVYGLEIGQRNKVNDVETFNKYARFTSDRLSFYDSNDVEVAYISDYKLYITHAQIVVLELGAFRIDSTKGFRIKYIGRG